MRILLYSDLHISRTSSILPIGNDSKYTYRQQMIINTADWLSQIMVNERPDLIINCGDTFDQHTITSYDINVASKFFAMFSDRMKMNNIIIPHFVLVGNHEMINQNFNAISLLNNIEGIKVISEPTTWSTQGSEKLDLAFLPYCNYNDVLSFPEGTYLFSHQDIQGSTIRGNFVMPEGLTSEQLKQYKLVFNGHIHKSSSMNNIINLGSVTTHSFSDDEEAVPQAYIFDTQTMNLQIFKNYNCPLFRKFNITHNLGDLCTFVDSLDPNYKYLLHVITPFECKENVKAYLDGNAMILNSRINVKIEKEKESKEVEEINLQSNVDINQSFKEFLNITDLKYPKEMYLKILEGVNI